jgi:hypothetical protein
MEVVIMEGSTQSATRHSPDQDLALVTATRRGDIAAFEELVRRYDRKLLRIAHQVTSSLEDAQDVVQETFLTKGLSKAQSISGDLEILHLADSYRSERVPCETAKAATHPGPATRVRGSKWREFATGCRRLVSESGTALQSGGASGDLSQNIRGTATDSPSSLRPPRRRGPLHPGNNGNTGPTTKCGKGAPFSCAAAASRKVNPVFPAAVAHGA